MFEDNIQLSSAQEYRSSQENKCFSAIIISELFLYFVSFFVVLVCMAFIFILITVGNSRSPADSCNQN